jgi:hypothetical protein
LDPHETKLIRPKIFTVNSQYQISPKCVQYNSSVGIATGYGLDGRGSIPGRDKMFLFPIAPRALGPTQFPIQWVPGALSSGIKRSGREDDHSSPSSVEVKDDGAIPLLPHTPSWRGA